jgi:hypothetical protein
MRQQAQQRELAIAQDTSQRPLVPLLRTSDGEPRLRYHMVSVGELVMRLCVRVLAVLQDNGTNTM